MSLASFLLACAISSSQASKCSVHGTATNTSTAGGWSVPIQSCTSSTDKKKVVWCSETHIQMREYAGAGCTGAEQPEESFELGKQLPDGSTYTCQIKDNSLVENCNAPNSGQSECKNSAVNNFGLKDEKYISTMFSEAGENTMWGHGCSYCTNFDSDMSQPYCKYVVQDSGPNMNGCGVSGAALPPSEGFTPACNFHDVCYGRCTDPRGKHGPFLQWHCDIMFWKLMHDYCAGYSVCEVKAKAFYYAVRNAVGVHLAFHGAVNSRCKCAPTPYDGSGTWYKNLKDDIDASPALYKNYTDMKPLFDDADAFNTFLQQSIIAWDAAESVKLQAEITSSNQDVKDKCVDEDVEKSWWSEFGDVTSTVSPSSPQNETNGTSSDAVAVGSTSPVMLAFLTSSLFVF